MTPTLNEGDIVVSVKGSKFEPGDLVAFYLGNKILVKRCIAGPGQWVDIDEEGNVYVDGKLLEEPYLAEGLLAGALLDGEHGDDASHPEDQSEHREEGAQLVEEQVLDSQLDILPVA